MRLRAGQWQAALQAYEDAGQLWAGSLQRGAAQPLSLPEVSWLEDGCGGSPLLSPLGTPGAAAGMGARDRSPARGTGVEAWGWAGGGDAKGAWDARQASAWGGQARTPPSPSSLPLLQEQQPQHRRRAETVAAAWHNVPVLLGGQGLEHLRLSPDKQM